MDDNIEVAALSLSTQNNSVRFDKDLGACQGYTIQIIPYTKQNLDGELDHIDVETKAAIVNYEKVSKYIYVYIWIYLNNTLFCRSNSSWWAMALRRTAWS